MSWNHKCQQKRCGGKDRGKHKDGCLRFNPQISERCGQRDGCDMVDGESNRGGRRDIGRIGDFLEIGFLSECQCKEQVVDNVQRCR